jgi:ribosomal protein S27E
MFGFATTKCGKCENRTFKVQELSLKGELDSRMISVQCTSCKTPIGVFEYNSALLQQQQARILRVERRLSSMEDKLADIEDKLSEIASALRQRGFTTQARQSG